MRRMPAKNGEKMKKRNTKTEIVIKIVTLFYRRDKFGMCPGNGGR